MMILGQFIRAMHIPWVTHEQATKVGPRGGLLTDIDSKPPSATYGARMELAQAMHGLSRHRFRGSTV